MKNLGIALTVLLMGTAAWARGGGSGTYVGLNLDYQSMTMTSEVGATTTESKSNSLDYDFQAGYVMSSGLYLGVVYNSTSTTDDVTDPKTSAYGVSFGYMNKGFLLVGHYFLNAEQSDSADNKLTGSAIGADLGYMFQVTGSFHLGGVMAYRSVTYNKLTQAGTEVPDASVKITAMEPKLVLGFLF